MVQQCEDALLWNDVGLALEDKIEIGVHHRK
jgi:hypothetical protein